MRRPLFRRAALAANRSRPAGRIVLALPVPLRLLAGVAAGVACAVAAFLALGTYTQHVRLAGQLMPDRGLIGVFAQGRGTVVEKHVVEGQLVRRGELLFAISSERASSGRGPTEWLIGRQLAQRRASLEEQISHTRLLAEREGAAFERRIGMLEAELASVENMIAGQRERLALAAEGASRHQALGNDGFVSREQLMLREQDLLDQRARLQSLERERFAMRRQISDLRAQAADVPLHYGNRLAELERALLAAEQEAEENETSRRLLVLAPEAGEATAVAGELGQRVDVAQPLLWLVPEGAVLQAHLYARGDAVGFIAAGDEVRLRYQSYPYQQFGHQVGKVTAVSRAAVPAAALPGAELLAELSREPVYRVIVEPDAQTLTAYGREHHLRSGMLLEADVARATRRLYQWVLEP